MSIKTKTKVQASFIIASIFNNGFNIQDFYPEKDDVSFYNSLPAKYKSVKTEGNPNYWNGLLILGQKKKGLQSPGNQGEQGNKVWIKWHFLIFICCHFFIDSDSNYDADIDESIILFYTRLI